MRSPEEHAGDVRDLPNYAVQEVASWLGLRAGTLRSWQASKSRESGGEEPRLFIPASEQPLRLSFWNVVECSTLASFRSSSGSWASLLGTSLLHVARELKIDRPLIDKRFAMKGLSRFLEHFGEAVESVDTGRPPLEARLRASFDRIEWDDSGLAHRLFLWTHAPDDPKVVAIDPEISFGRPTLRHTSVAIDTLMERFRAGDTIELLAADYRVSTEDIESVVRWAAGGTAAA